jgi:hypothetical protein
MRGSTREIQGHLEEIYELLTAVCGSCFKALCLDPIVGSVHINQLTDFLWQYSKRDASAIGGNRSAGSRTRVEADDAVFVRAEVAHAGLVISQRLSTHCISVLMVPVATGVTAKM